VASREVRRGDIRLVDWSPSRGSEQAGMRPAVVVQTDAANLNPRYPNTIVVTVSTKGKPVPFHVSIEPSEQNGLKEKSFVKCEQVLTIADGRG
jgi:mRNA interferase MazF